MKLIIAIGVVVILSVIAERVSPKIAGILSGYPTGSAITLFYFGLEQGVSFAAQSAVYNMIGIVAQLSFFYFYYKASSYFKKYTIALSSIVSIIGYFLVIWLLYFIKLNKFIAIIFPFLSMVLFIFLFKEIKNVKIKKKTKLSPKILLLRAVFAASIMLTVIGVAKIVGPTWSGLFSAFPTTTFPLMLIINFSYGTDKVHTIIKNVPVGIGSLIIYSLSISVAYPVFGIYIGTLISFGVATIYIFASQIVQNTIKKFRSSIKTKNKAYEIS